MKGKSMAKFIIDTDKCTCKSYENFSSYSEGYERGKADMKKEILSKTNWIDNSYTDGYNKAVDDFVKECDKIMHFNIDKHPANGYVTSRKTLLDIAEQLKAGGEYNNVEMPKKQTNADRIRSMSDDELLAFLRKTECFICLLEDEKIDCSGTEECGMCESVIENWLKSEVEE